MKTIFIFVVIAVFFSSCKRNNPTIIQGKITEYGTGIPLPNVRILVYKSDSDIFDIYYDPFSPIIIGMHSSQKLVGETTSDSNGEYYLDFIDRKTGMLTIIVESTDPAMSLYQNENSNINFSSYSSCYQYAYEGVTASPKNYETNTFNIICYPYKKLNIKAYNANCFDQNDHIQFQFSSPIYELVGMNSTNSGGQNYGCDSLITSGAIFDPTYISYEVTKNGATTTFYDTLSGFGMCGEMNYIVNY
ncbi:MAG: hypothetical protein R2799_00805 [Crocinitomicaceae bacterium]